MRNKARRWFTALLLLGSTVALARTDTVLVTRATAIGVGAVNVLDTYLSPEKYRGTEVRLLHQVVREPVHSRRSRQFTLQGAAAFANNRAGNGTETVGQLNAGYAWHYNFYLCHQRLNIKVGAMADANLGVIYNNRNGNNPAQARAYINLQPSAVATYRLHWRQHPLLLRYEVSAPLVGVMFSPQYGQSYYEIFSEGNYDHNVVPTTFVSTPSLRHMLTVDFKIGKTTLRTGYIGDYQQARVNHLKSHIYTHAWVLGIVKHFSIARK